MVPQTAYEAKISHRDRKIKALQDQIQGLRRRQWQNPNEAEWTLRMEAVNHHAQFIEQQANFLAEKDHHQQQYISQLESKQDKGKGKASVDVEDERESGSDSNSEDYEYDGSDTRMHDADEEVRDTSVIALGLPYMY